MTIRTKNVPIEVMLVWSAISIALVGFTITITGAFLVGWTMFNGSNDVSNGFGLILIGNSITLLGIVIIVPAFMISLFRWYREDTQTAL